MSEKFNDIPEIKTGDPEFDAKVNKILKGYDESKTDLDVDDEAKETDAEHASASKPQTKTEETNKAVDDKDISNKATIKKDKDIGKEKSSSDNKDASKSKKRKKKKLRKALYIITMAVLICVFVGSAAYLINYYMQAKKIDNKADELKDIISDDVDTGDYDAVETITDDNGHVTEFVLINGKKVQKKFAAIFEKNNDFVGWLKIDGTVIDYPVMQTPDDEEFYLHRDFDKNYNGNGTLFADTDADLNRPSDNIIIYGHNMKNGRMFHSILEYDNEDYYKEHKYIEFDTIYGDGKYEVIAAFTGRIYDKDYTGFKYYTFFDAATEEEFDSFVKSCKELTRYNIPTTATYGDKLITLSTCATSDDAGRFVVVAKKVE